MTMNKGTIQSKAVPILQGRREEASYSESSLVDYRGNPLIEALPPIYDAPDVVTKIASLPYYDESERKLRPALRLHCIMRIADFVQPLSSHVDIEQRFSRMIRHGYKARNPMSPNHARRLRNADILKPSFDDGSLESTAVSSSAAGFTIIGISGIGKTTTVERNLLLYPQVIVHNEYAGRNLPLYQVVWLKLECPHDGSTKSLCLNFLQALDSLLGTNYFDKHKSNNENVLISLMARIASLHCLGMLVIDEIQNLSEAKSGGSSKMLNFFVQLVNTIGVPLVLVGTYKATYLLSGEFRKGRRGTGHQGGLVWNRMEMNKEWDILINGLWRYQWTEKPSILTDELKELLYQESQGITDIAVKLYMLAQWRAISTGIEEVNSRIIKSVAKDSLKLIRPALDALRSGNKKEIARFEDIRFPIEEIETQLQKASSQVEVHGAIEELTNFKQSSPLNRNIQVAEILAWLVQAGFEISTAEKVANQVVGESSDDITAVRQRAFALCYQEKESGQVSGVEIKEEKSSSPRSAKPKNNRDLRVVTAKAKKKKIPAYEALKDSGYIKAIEELSIG